MTKVAVVEDNPDNRLLVRAILEDRYEIVEYASGKEALELLPDALPDIVLLDISLPELDGTEVLAALRADERTKHIPVVALTAHAMVGDRERFLEAGFDDYMSKPILDPEALAAVIDGALGRLG